MSTPATYLILAPADDAGNRVVINASVGSTVLIDDGATIILRDEAAADAWIGWSKLADGSFQPPPSVPPANEPGATNPALLAQLLARIEELENLMTAP